MELGSAQRYFLRNLLIHFPLFQFLRQTNIQSEWAFLLALIITIVLAYFSWKAIEQPAMRWAKRQITKPITD